MNELSQQTRRLVDDVTL